VGTGWICGSAPVRKSPDGAKLRMLADNGSDITVQALQVANDGDVTATVDWHGPRLDIRYDGIPDETWAPIPVGGIFAHQLRFPDAGFYWYHPHIFA
jgi:FtsP/CotA-like multicopper oxidase with cupredoxin domain